MATFTHDQYQKIVDLSNVCEERQFFEVDGLIVEGNTVAIIKEYVLSNPSKKFREWLHDSEYAVEVRRIN